MMDLPMMGAAGIPDQASYFPPAPSAVPTQSGGFGSLGGLGQSLADQLNSPTTSNILRSAFMSMMTSPSNNWLKNMPDIHSNMQEQAQRQQALAQQAQQQEQRQLELERKRQQELAQGNQTAAWLKSKFGLSDEDAMAAASNPTILGHYLKQAQAGTDTRFGLNPIYGTDAEGKTVMGVLGTDGSFKPVDTGGVSLATGVDRVDLGTHFGLLDKRTGQMVGTLPKENYQEAFDTAQGRAEGQSRGEANATAPGDYQAGQNALDLIDALRKHPGLDRGTGMTAIANAIPGTIGYDFQNLVEQAKGGAFLTAVQQMRGLGALSNAEGAAATQAVTRMNTSTSKEAFLAALDDYEKIVRQGMERAASNMRVGSSGSAPRSSSTGIQWSIEE